MGAHTAFLAEADRPDRVERLVMLEGHVAGVLTQRTRKHSGASSRPGPTPFVDGAAARAYLGDDAIADAWVADLEVTSDGLCSRFDADVMERIIAAVHEPRWAEWETLEVLTLAVFADDGMFSAVDKDELIRRRPTTERVDLDSGGHDAHLDAFDEWIDALRGWLLPM